MSSHEIGVPSLHTAFGLIFTSTVSGLSLVFTTSPRFLAMGRLPWSSKYTNDGITWFVTNWFANRFSADVPWLSPLKTSGSAMVIVPPLAAAPVVVAPPAVVAAAPPAAVVVAPPPAVVVFVELPLLSPPQAAAIIAAPRSTTAALAAPAVPLTRVTSWVRASGRGRDASGRPDNPLHRNHPNQMWGHGTHPVSTRRCSACRSTGQYLPFDVWPTNGGGT